MVTKNRSLGFKYDDLVVTSNLPIRYRQEKDQECVYRRRQIELCACGRPRLLGTGSPILYQSQPHTETKTLSQNPHHHPELVVQPSQHSPCLDLSPIEPLQLFPRARANERTPFHLRTSTGVGMRVFCSWLGGMGNLGCFFGEKDRERVAFVRGCVDIWLGRGPLHGMPDVSMGAMPAVCGKRCSLGM